MSSSSASKKRIVPIIGFDLVKHFSTVDAVSDKVSTVTIKPEQYKALDKLIGEFYGSPLIDITEVAHPWQTSKNDLYIYKSRYSFEEIKEGLLFPVDANTDNDEEEEDNDDVDG